MEEARLLGEAGEVPRHAVEEAEGEAVPVVQAGEVGVGVGEALQAGEAGGGDLLDDTDTNTDLSGRLELGERESVVDGGRE